MTQETTAELDARKAALLRRQSQLEARLQAKAAREGVRRRKADTRRKIIAGALCLTRAENDPEFRQWLAAALAASLKPAEHTLFADLL